MTSLVVQTERLLLPAPVPEDAVGAAELLTDPEVTRFLGGQVVLRDDVPPVIENWLGR